MHPLRLHCSQSTVPTLQTCACSHADMLCRVYTAELRLTSHCLLLSSTFCLFQPQTIIRRTVRSSGWARRQCMPHALSHLLMTPRSSRCRSATETCLPYVHVCDRARIYACVHACVPACMRVHGAYVLMLLCAPRVHACECTHLCVRVYACVCATHASLFIARRLRRCRH